MKAELIDVSECKKNLDIEIPQEVVDAEIAHIANDFAKKARVPGFRPGKAPVAVVKTRYREEIISEMMQHLLPKYFGDAVDERKLEIVKAPQFESVDYASGKPLRFKAVFEVYPSLNITNYTDVPVEQVSTAVQESEVDESLKRLQEDNDEFAQRFGDYKTVDDLRKKIREDIEKHKSEGAQEQMREKILEWLEDNNEFEIPESLVERQLQVRVQRLVRDLARQGINPQRLDVDWGKIREDQQKQAERDVKGSLILDYISNKENIRVTDD